MHVNSLFTEGLFYSFVNSVCYGPDYPILKTYTSDQSHNFYSCGPAHPEEQIRGAGRRKGDLAQAGWLAQGLSRASTAAPAASTGLRAAAARTQVVLFRQAARGRSRTAPRGSAALELPSSCPRAAREAKTFASRARGKLE